MDASVMERDVRPSSFPGAFADDLDEARAESGRIALLPEPSAIRLPVVYEAGRPVDGGAVECDGAHTLRLVEQAVRSMQDLQGRADLISARALDLIQVTHQERTQLRADLQAARDSARAWEAQARAREDALRTATLQIRDADLTRRELELRVRQATERAEAAEERVTSLEHYLKAIRAFLEARMMALRG